MTTRTTSAEAYRHLVDTGQLIGKQQRIMERLVAMGQATSGEVLSLILGVGNTNAWRARFTELHKRGLIQEAGQRKCAVSGRNCIVWTATNRTKPLDPSKPKVKDVVDWQAIAGKLAAALDGMLALHPSKIGRGALNEYLAIPRSGS